MTSTTRHLLLALAALAATTCAYGQQASRLVTRTIALEVPAASMTLPISATSAAVFPPCGDCPPKSFPVTANTTYYINREVVTLAELKSIVVGRPDLILTAVYSASTGALVSVTADVPAASRNAR